jgi:hypothetical protein
MPAELPNFDKDEVALLISAVERALKNLKRANEKQGGNDSELLEYGRRYSVVLEKLYTVLNATA